MFAETKVVQVTTIGSTMMVSLLLAGATNTINPVPHVSTARLTPGCPSNYCLYATTIDTDASFPVITDRFCRFNTTYGFGEHAPASILASAKTTHLSFTDLNSMVSTYKVKPLRVSWRGVAGVGYVITFIITCIEIIAFTLCLTRFGRLSFPRSKASNNAISAVAFLCATGILGFLSGSRLVIDNATDNTVAVRVDGRVVAILLPRTYIEQRVGGNELNVEVLAVKGLIESGILRLDADIGHTIWRAFFGSATFIYNIEGRNGYWVHRTEYEHY